jgi:5-methylcytosine-specific restriction endonuclease McrA
LTLDHVVPKCKGGRSTWDNLVACCHPCNNRKGDKTPAEARMALARAPRPFSSHAKHRAAAGDECWGKYLFV